MLRTISPSGYSSLIASTASRRTGQVCTASSSNADQMNLLRCELMPGNGNHSLSRIVFVLLPATKDGAAGTEVGESPSHPASFTWTSDYLTIFDRSRQGHQLNTTTYWQYHAYFAACCPSEVRGILSTTTVPNLSSQTLSLSFHNMLFIPYAHERPWTM